MTFAELLQEVKKLPFEEKRVESRLYLEFVMQVDILDKLHPILKRYFGHAMKSAGEKVHQEAFDCMEYFGGIRSDQTLYYAERDGFFDYAVVWPWADQSSVTVKIFREDRKR